MGFMIRTRSRAVLLASAAFLAGAPTAFASQAEHRLNIDIPAQRLDGSLRELGRETHADILFTPAAAAGYRAPSVHGLMSPRAAVERLIAGTTLQAVVDDRGAILISARLTKSSLSVPAALVQAAVPQPDPPAPEAASQQQPASTLGEVVVTAQKREESVQRVPIAVTALTDAQLQRQKIDDGRYLVLQVPNTTFSRSLFGSNFQIRGIGNQLVAVSADNGVGVHLNYVPQTTDHLSDAEFFDLERVEVLRGPQGTLFGRNVTGGVINEITAKPKTTTEGLVSAEFGNFDTKKFKGMFNTPLGHGFALRLAGVYVDRDGYTQNTQEDQSIDGRRLWSTRATLAYDGPGPFSGYFMWEHYSENDDRIPESKKLCIKDPGTASIGGQATGSYQNQFSQGCQAGSLYQSAAYGTQNTAATILGSLAQTVGLSNGGDLLAGKVQSTDLREVEKLGSPTYRVNNDQFQLNLQYKLTPSLTAVSLTSWQTDHTSSLGDSESAQASVPYLSSALFPGGVVDDPQLGPSNRTQSGVLIDNHSHQFSQEVRLQSSFDGPVNFTLGGIYIDYSLGFQQYVFINQITAVAQLEDKLLNAGIYIDPNRSPNGQGHNYLYAPIPYHLESKAAFGEVYWDVTPTLKITGGARYSSDEKSFVNYPSTLLNPGQGTPPGDTYDASFGAWTGRFNVQWTPQTRFTDRTMVYASYSRGYKAGGFNPPQTVSSLIPADFAPEGVNAYEIGTKNTLLGGRMTQNLTAFYYDYQNYQISELVQRTAVNVNVNAEVKGLEWESVWQPIDGLRLNANIGLLDSGISGGATLDTLNRTGGNANYVVVKAADSSNCIAPAAGVASLLGAINSGAIAKPANLNGICAGAYAGGPYNITPLDGIATPVKGNDLPNAPPWTVSLGVEYGRPIGGDWRATIRADYYRQGDSFARIFMTDSDRIESWQNANMTLTFDNDRLKTQVQLYVRNIADSQTIIGISLSDDIFGLTRAVNVLDPRLFGATITKRF